MKAALPAVLVVLWSAGCGGGSPSTPSTPSPPPSAPPVTSGTLILSGVVYGSDASGRRPLAGATVDIREPDGAWGMFGRTVTNISGRYVFGSLSSRHYQARATMPGYDESPAVTVGFLETSKTVDLEVVQTGLITGPMTVSSIAPAVGSTAGGTPIVIAGTGFRAGVSVTFDAEPIIIEAQNTTTIYATTPVHAATTATVKVTNVSGESATLTGGFRYAAPQTFNFSGAWTGWALAHPSLPASVRVPTHSDMEMSFTIENNVVTAFTCDGVTVALPAPLPAISNGAFSWTVAGGGGTLSGRIVSDTIAVGTIDTLVCPATRWQAARK